MLAVLARHPTSRFLMVVSEEMLHALGCQHYRAAFLASLPVLNFTQDKLVAKVTRDVIENANPLDLDHFFKQRCSAARRGRVRSPKKHHWGGSR